MWLALLIRADFLPAIFPNHFTTELPPNMITTIWWLPVIGFCFLAYEELYTKRLSFWREFEKIISALILSCLMVLALLYLMKIHAEVSRTFILLTFVVSLFLLPAMRYLIKNYLSRFQFWCQRVLVISEEPGDQLAATSLLKNPYLGYEVVDFGTPSECAELVERTKAEMIVIAVYNQASRELVMEKVNEMHKNLHYRLKSLLLIPGISAMPFMGIEANCFDHELQASMHIRNKQRDPLRHFMKRSFDIVVSLLILLIIWPILILLAVIIKLDSPGPAIFSQKRLGFNWQTFTCFKFRTMHQNAEQVLREVLESDPALKKEWEQYFKLKRDPRVTRIGKILRATSLDELPQLINVIKGEMSLVGPRPKLLYNLDLYNLENLESSLEQYGLELKDLRELFDTTLEVRPGITGLWQVAGRSDMDFVSAMFLEAFYVRNWTLILDISISVRTVGAVFQRRGAY